MMEITSDMLDEMEGVLRDYGDYETLGLLGDVRIIACDWYNCGFGPGQVVDWLNAGIWCPHTAELIRSSGLSPADLRSVDKSYIHSACNGKIRVEDLVRRIKRT